MNKAIYLLFALMLASCAAMGPVYQDAPAPPPGKALIYIYRAPGFAFAARSAAFYLDKVEIADLGYKGYTWAYVDPGQHLLVEDWGPEDFFVDKIVQLQTDLQPGGVYYYRLSTHLVADPVKMLHGMEWQIEKVDPAFGRHEIVDYFYEPSRQNDGTKTK